MRPSVYITLFISTLGLIGCGDQAGRSNMHQPPELVQRLDAITLMSMPSAINFDHIPGPDGLRVQALLFQTGRDEPVLGSGKLQFLLYENKVTASQLRTLHPLLTWTYSGQKLARHAGRSMVGWGYAMELRWGPRPPKSKIISLAARYIFPDGRSIYSSPIVIAMR